MYAANRHEIDTDEAVQRAALAMIPNPIYSGNPIYDEIADPKLLKFLQSEKSESQSRDECYVEISSQATNMCATPQPGLESKLVRDKCTTYPVSAMSLQCYTKLMCIVYSLSICQLINFLCMSSSTVLLILDKHSMRTVYTEYIAQHGTEKNKIACNLGCIKGFPLAHASI